MYARLASDAKALDLAVRFTNGELGRHRLDKWPADQRRFSGFEPDGSFAGHFHSKTTTLLGIAKLGRLLLERGRKDDGLRYLRAARRSFDWIFATLDPALGEWADLHDDVEAMTLNMIARSQIRLTPEFKSFLAARPGADAAAALETARRLDGAWPTDPMPNDLLTGSNIPMSGCCQYAGLRGLYAGWRDAMTFADGKLRINYFTARRSPQAEMSSAMPAKGEAGITLRADAEVFVRVPRWLRADAMPISAKGPRRNNCSILVWDRLCLWHGYGSRDSKEVSISGIAI